jgi:hypothetical protein
MAMVMMGVQQHSGGVIFFDRNGTLTPKDRYLFRWVETCWNHQSESMGDFARCHGQPGTSLDLAQLEPMSTHPQDSQKLAEWKTCLSAVTSALWQLFMFFKYFVLEISYNGGTPIAGWFLTEKNNTVSHGWFRGIPWYLYRTPPYELENQGIMPWSHMLVIL